MNKFSEHLQSDDEKSREVALRSGVRQLMDNELRAELESELAQRYNLHRNQKKSGTKITTMRVLVTVSSIAASMMILLSLYWWLTPPNLNTMTTSFLQEWYSHPGATKGATQNNDHSLRSEAIKAYEDHDFPKAAEHFSKIDSTTNEDDFFLGLSLLYSGKYAMASEKLENLDKDNQIYREEINWYLGLCYLKMENNSNSIQVLKNIKPGEWNYEKAQKLLGSIDK